MLDEVDTRWDWLTMVLNICKCVDEIKWLIWFKYYCAHVGFWAIVHHIVLIRCWLYEQILTCNWD